MGWWTKKEKKKIEERKERIVKAKSGKEYLLSGRKISKTTKEEQLKRHGIIKTKKEKQPKPKIVYKTKYKTRTRYKKPKQIKHVSKRDEYVDDIDFMNPLGSKKKKKNNDWFNPSGFKGRLW